MKSYIRGIDGLRAIAVVAVILFHAFPTALPGGFIGVDIFFVISGFIITTTYLSDLREKRLSLRHFFMKRVRRLAPIYFVVLFATTVASYAVLTPVHLNHFAESLLAQPAYVQNIVFWRLGDYFDKALSKPLLHTWSLAVEEQFYLAYALMILVIRRAPKVTLPLVVFIGISSFLFAWVLGGVAPTAAFYLLPSRAWQLAMGVFIAMLTMRLGGSDRRWVMGVGAVLVAWAIIGFDEHARFPGPQSVAAALGTSLALLAVTARDASAWWAVRILGTPVLTHMGKISYSLYLWHWPILALASTFAGRNLRFSEAIVALVITAFLSHVSYMYIENPVRNRRFVPRNGALLRLAGLSAFATAAIALLFLATSGATFRYPSEIARLYVAQQQRSPFRCPTLGRVLAPRAETCKINDVDSRTNVLVLGDSHADVLDESIASLARAQGMGAFLTKRDCKLSDFGVREDCSAAVFASIRHEIETHSIRYVFSMAYTKNEGESGGALKENARLLLGNVDTLFLMQVVPSGPHFDPAERAHALRHHEALPLPYPTQDYERNNAVTFESLRGIATKNPRIQLLDPSSYLCGTAICDFDTDGVPNYFDAHHLSPTGAARVAPMFARVLSELPRAAMHSVKR